MLCFFRNSMGRHARLQQLITRLLPNRNTKGMGKVVYKKVWRYELSWNRKSRVTAFLGGPFRWGLWGFKWQGFEVSEDEEFWEGFKSCTIRYLGQGGTGKLGSSGLEGIQNLEGTGKLYVGQTGFGQKGILERTEIGKFVNSWLTTLKKNCEKGTGWQTWEV